MVITILKSKTRILLGIFGAIALVSLVGFGVYSYMVLRNEVEQLRNSPRGVQEAAKEETAKLIDQVKKLINVPEDETPTVATVSDSEKLKNNPFFANAQNGDKVLIFSTTKKAIIFRPGENKIIEVGPISIGTPSASASQNQKIQFILYNGTNVTGLTKTYEATLVRLLQSAKVIDRDNAKKRDYAKSVLIDISGSKTKEAREIADTLGMEVSSLPEGETKPDSGDFLIILGEDKK